MKILFLATYFPKPLNPMIGTWALEQAKAFTSMDPSISLRVVSGNPWFPKIVGRWKTGIRAYSDCPQAHSWNGVEVEYPRMFFYSFGVLDGIFNRVGEPLLQMGWWSIRARVMKIVQEFQPTVVYAHHTIPNGYFAMRIKKELGIPFFVTDHETGEITACETFSARRAVYEKVIEAAEGMVSVAEVMQRDMKAIFPKARSFVIPNGINLAPRSTGGSEVEQIGMRGSRHVTSNFSNILILSCGMFYERKNFPGLIQAFNLVAERHSGALLRILGDGPDRHKVEKERNMSPYRDRIQMPGRVAHETIVKEMRIADIFMLIGWREPFGVVFLEAMAEGVPVIACEDAGVAEVITGLELSKMRRSRSEKTGRPSGPNFHLQGTRSHSNADHEIGKKSSPAKPPSVNDPDGILVPPRDIGAASEALDFLISNSEMRKKMGAAARRKIESNFTWSAINLKYRELFQKVTRQSPVGMETSELYG